MAICRSYIKNPEALRFQKELFARTFGKHYSIITRIAHCVCQVIDTAPAWVTEAKARAARLVKHWKTLQVTLDFAVAKLAAYVPKFNGPKPYLTTNSSGRAMTCGGAYRRFCPTQKHANYAGFGYRFTN